MRADDEAALAHAHASVMVRRDDLARVLGALEGFYDGLALGERMGAPLKESMARIDALLGLEPRKAVQP